MRSRCVEVCLGCGEMYLGCGERCGKGVGVGAKGVGLGLVLGKGRWGCREGWCHDLGPQLSRPQSP